MLEARATITQTLDDFLCSEEDRKYVTCDLNEDVTDIVSLYEAATGYLENKRGRANYSGKGPVYPDGNEGSNPGVFIEDYSRSLQISWWKTPRGVFAALVSSHDADSLYCFTVVYRKSVP